MNWIMIVHNIFSLNFFSSFVPLFFQIILFLFLKVWAFPDYAMQWGGGRIFYKCASDLKDPSRRYDWVEYEDGTILGDNKQCKSKNLTKNLFCKNKTEKPIKSKTLAVAVVNFKITLMAKEKVFAGIRFLQYKL